MPPPIAQPLDQPPSSTPTFHSAPNRIRDRTIEDKHQRELTLLHNKLNSLKRSNKDLLTQLYDANLRTQNLVGMLGFEDVGEMERVLEEGEYGGGLSYRECLERNERVEEEVARLGEANAQLNETLKEKETELSEMRSAKSQNASNPLRDSNANINTITPAGESLTNSHHLQRELMALQLRYNSLLDVKNRAAQRYKSDYKRWSEIKTWLFNDEKQQTQGSGRNTDVVMKKRKLFAEHGPDLTWFNVEGEDERPEPAAKRLRGDEDKENVDVHSKEHPPSVAVKKEREHTPVLGNVHHLSSPSTSKGSTPTLVGSSAGRTAAEKSKTPQLPKTPPPPPRSKLTSNATVRVKEEEEVEIITPRPIKRRHSSGAEISHRETQHIGSSDTEDDSQAPNPTESYLDLHGKERRRSDIGTSVILQTAAATTTSPRPHKITQFGLEEDPNPFFDTREGDGEPRRRDVGGWSSPPPIADSFEDPPNAVRGSSPSDDVDFQKERDGDFGGILDLKGKGKAKVKETPVKSPHTPMGAPPSSSAKKLNDYLAYKGRGRYAAEAKSAEKTINAAFAINPDRNNGRDFQYEEVVRGKDERRRMDAGDCECCRDYYEAVGPLPKRAGQPLWRSPLSTPVKPKPCPTHHPHQHDDPAPESAAQRQGETEEERDKQRHKQAISRHRHNWARAATPPGYWNIGFPDTQEAGNINDRAREMEKRKREGIEREAERENGRYRRK